MPISPFILNLRRKIGHDLLHLIGVSGVVTNGRGEVLLVKSKDHGQWMPIGGMVEVGEEPADAIVREVREETGVAVTVDRLAGVFDGPRVTYGNGDQTHYVTVVFRCTAAADAVARVADEENSDARFCPPDQLPAMREDHSRNIACALSVQERAAFVTG